MFFIYNIFFFCSKRYNDNVFRNELINSLALLVQDKNIFHKVDLKQSKKTIIIEIIKNICCISVIPDYHKYKKYNLLELTKTVFDDSLVTDKESEESNKPCTEISNVVNTCNEIIEENIVEKKIEIGNNNIVDGKINSDEESTANHEQL